MRDPSFWRDLQGQFKGLSDSARSPVNAWLGQDGVWLLVGGPDDAVQRTALQNQLRALVERGGNGLEASATGEAAVAIWMNRICDQSPRIHVHTSSSCTGGGNEAQQLVPIQVARLDLPGEPWAEEDRRRPWVVVERADDGRYLVIAGHDLFQARVAAKLSRHRQLTRSRSRTRDRRKSSPSRATIRCLVVESTQVRECEIMKISDVCAASVELCVRLETDAEVARGVPVNSAQSTANDALPPNADSAMKRTAVEAYRDEVFEKTGQRIPQAAIWRAARYRTRTEYERWLRNDKAATKTADRNIRRVLTQKPHISPGLSPTRDPRDDFQEG